MIAFLAWTLFTVLVIGAGLWLVETFPLPLSPIARWIVRVVVVLAALIFIGTYLLPMAGAPHWPR